jgi:hypothetical protein
MRRHERVTRLGQVARRRPPYIPGVARGIEPPRDFSIGNDRDDWRSGAAVPGPPLRLLPMRLMRLMIAPSPPPAIAATMSPAAAPSPSSSPTAAAATTWLRPAIVVRLPGESVVALWG